MQTSKKQIFIFQKCNLIDQPVGIYMATTSIRKIKRFIVSKILDYSSDIFYNNEEMNKTMQKKKNSYLIGIDCIEIK